MPLHDPSSRHVLAWEPCIVNPWSHSKEHFSSVLADEQVAFPLIRGCSGTHLFAIYEEIKNLI